MYIKNKRFIITILIALILKLSLFVFAEIHAPQVKFQNDSDIYIQTAENLAKHRAFTTEYRPDRKYPLEMLRTPGYPVFLAMFHGMLKISYNGIILIQIALTLLVAFIVYKTALHIEPRLAYLSALIILFDPPVTIFSLFLLTETLFLFLLSVSMYLFILYLKEQKAKYIVWLALMVSAATYVRPIAYFLGLAIGVFMVYFSFRTRIKRVLIHALVFLLIIYSLLGLWHFHNYKVAGKNTFTDMVSFVPGYRNYIIRDDEIVNSLSPIPRYLNIASRSFVSLMTRPATLKAFNSPTLKRAEKIFEYPWIVFWFLGFLVGISKIEKSIYLQFLSYVAFYFICATVAAISFGVSSRQRAPLMPFIAILSAYGWTWIISTLKSRQQKAYDNG